VGGPQCHRRVAQKPAGILKVGHVMQLDAVHAPDPHGVSCSLIHLPDVRLGYLAKQYARRSRLRREKICLFSKLRVATAPRQQIRGESDHGGMGSPQARLSRRSIVHSCGGSSAASSN
jgi:hypothetical protein